MTPGIPYQLDLIAGGPIAAFPESASQEARRAGQSPAKYQETILAVFWKDRSKYPRLSRFPGDRLPSWANKSNRKLSISFGSRLRFFLLSSSLLPVAPASVPFPTSALF